MRITKQQQELLDLMTETSDEDCYYWSVSQLMEQTGRSQPSIFRSLKTFEANGLITKRKVTGELILHTAWYLEYILITNLEEQAEFETEKSKELVIEKKRAKELGYKSVEEYRMANFFDNFFDRAGLYMSNRKLNGQGCRCYFP